MYEYGVESIDFNKVLDCLDPNVYHDEWIKIGMALHHASCNGANDINANTFEVWSSGATRLSERDQKPTYRLGVPTQQWNNFKENGGITYATLLGMAKKKGHSISEFIKPSYKNNFISEPRRSGKTMQQKEQTKGRKIKKEIPSINEDDKKDILDTLKDTKYSSEYSLYAKNLDNTDLFNSTIGSRGISVETAREYDMFPVENITINEKRTYERGVMAYGSMGSFIFRNGLFKADSKSGQAGTNEYKFEKTKNTPFIPTGLKRVIDQKNKTTDSGLPAPVFVCEGTFDAPSFTEADPSVDAISVGNTANTLNAVIAVFEAYQIQRPLILICDNDRAGEASKKRIADMHDILSAAGIEYMEYDLVPNNLKSEVKDANEFLLKNKSRFYDQIQRAQIELYNTYGALTVRQHYDDFIQHLRDNANAPQILTGFKSLDSEKMLNGGLFPGLYILGAVSSLGKTTFALQLADNIAAAGHNVIFYSLEMSKYEMMAKSISRYTAQIAEREGIPRGYAASLREVLNARDYSRYSEDKKCLIEAAQREYLHDVGDNLFIMEGLGNISVDTIRAELERLVNPPRACKYHGLELPITPPVIFIDYLQILMPPGNNQRLSDKQVVDYNVFELKRLSREFNIPIIAISSFNRENYKKSLSMTAFKESGAIEYTSDVLLGLEREVTPENETAYEAAMKNEESTGIRDLRLKVLKNRNGQPHGSMLLTYNSIFNYYYNDRMEQK